MELHQLRYFVAVAQTGSFSRAAEECLVSQPSLSQQIQKLERQLGQRLFDRMGKRTVLTAAGTVLLEQAQAILAAVDSAERQMKEFDRQIAGRLAVGAIPTVAPYILPRVLRRFVRKFPQVELMLHEDLTAHLVAGVLKGELDLALLALPLPDRRLAWRSLMTDPLLVALPNDHALAKQHSISIDELRGERFIVLDEMHCLGEQILAFCRNEGIHRIVCRSAQIATVQMMIALGQGISLLPKLAEQVDRERRIAYRPFSSGGLQRTIVVAWHPARYRSAPAANFLTMLNDELSTQRS